MNRAYTTRRAPTSRVVRIVRFDERRTEVVALHVGFDLLQGGVARFDLRRAEFAEWIFLGVEFHFQQCLFHRSDIADQFDELLHSLVEFRIGNRSVLHFLSVDLFRLGF